MGRPWPEEQLVAQVRRTNATTPGSSPACCSVDGDKRRIDLYSRRRQKQRISHAAAGKAPPRRPAMLLQPGWANCGWCSAAPRTTSRRSATRAFWHRYAMARPARCACRHPGWRHGHERLVTASASRSGCSRWRSRRRAGSRASGCWRRRSACCISSARRSRREHARFVAEVFRQSPPNSAFARLRCGRCARAGSKRSGRRGIRDRRRCGGRSRLRRGLQRAEAAK